MLSCACVIRCFKLAYKIDERGTNHLVLSGFLCQVFIKRGCIVVLLYVVSLHFISKHVDVLTIILLSIMV